MKRKLYHCNSLTHFIFCFYMVGSFFSLLGLPLLTKEAISTIYDIRPIRITSAATVSQKNLPHCMGKKYFLRNKTIYGPFSAFHRTLPIGTILKITNTENHRCILVKITGHHITQAEPTLALEPEATDHLKIPEGTIKTTQLEILDPIEVITKPNLFPEQETTTDDDT